VHAYRTLSDVYAFRSLPGLVDHEQPGLHRPAPTSPPVARGFVVEVTDPEERFLPVAFGVDLPLPTPPLLPDAAAAATSPPGPPSGWLLYSTPSRRVPPGFAAVRGQLRLAQSGAAAGHALLEVETPQGTRWHGLSAPDGGFAVHFPYPVPPSLLATSPPTLPAGGLGDVEWPVVLRAWWNPATRSPLAGTGLPSYPSVLAQPPAGLYDLHPDDGGAPLAEWTGVVRYGRELVARTTPVSELLIEEPGTSP
jgi:hypothetical protein